MTKIDSLKEKLHFLIEKIEDEKTLRNYETSLINELRLSGKKDWWSDIPDSVKARLQESIKQLKEGKTKDFKAVLDKY